MLEIVFYAIIYLVPGAGVAWWFDRAALEDLPDWYREHDRPIAVAVVWLFWPLIVLASGLLAFVGDEWFEEEGPRGGHWEHDDSLEPAADVLSRRDREGMPAELSIPWPAGGARPDAASANLPSSRPTA